MADINATIEGQDLVIRIKMQDPEPSRSGDSLVIASTHGNARTDCVFNGSKVTIGLNAWVKNPNPPPKEGRR